MASRRGRDWWLCGTLIAANVVAWGWAWLTFAENAVLLGSALLAYSFGLRHAVDADHIAAIDNATRKLIEAGQDASTTGLFFSLGHATVVVLGAAAIALASARLQAAFGGLKPLAGTLSTGFSALCLFALAIANAFILASVCRLAAALKRGVQPGDPKLDRLLSQRGLMGRMLRGLFRLVSQSWHMYPIGFLFGLGFDTATEIGVLGVSAAQASYGLPFATIIVFPALFAAGMALVDTLDAIMMAGAYRWAASDPSRRLYYNLAITLTSIVVAAGIGSVELLGLTVGEQMSGTPWRIVARLNDNLTLIGILIVALFAISWLLSIVVARGRLGRPASVAAVADSANTVIEDLQPRSGRQEPNRLSAY